MRWLIDHLESRVLLSDIGNAGVDYAGVNMTGSLAGGFTVTVTRKDGTTLNGAGQTARLYFCTAGSTNPQSNEFFYSTDVILSNNVAHFAPSSYPTLKYLEAIGVQSGKTYDIWATYADWQQKAGMCAYHGWSYLNTDGLAAPQVVVTPVDADYNPSTKTEEVDVRWNTVSSASGYVVRVFDMSTGKVTDVPVTKAAWNGYALPVGKYTVKVTALYGGQKGPWSSAKAFEVWPNKVYVIGPLGAITRVAREDVPIRWEEPVVPAGVDHYQIELTDLTTHAEPVTFGNIPVDKTRVTQTWQMPGASLANGDNYEYEISGCGPVALGNVTMVKGPTEFKFVGLCLATPVLSLSAASGDNTVDLSWTRPSFADVLQYNVKLTDLTTKKSETMPYKSNNRTVTCPLTITNGVSGHKYAISIQAVGRGGHVVKTDSAWSAVKNYTIV